ncbi:hypothetical protein BC940DRAFT_309511 [Gongronella butleri]|nr:hypothetical protein BC940DRAFT_309511 [Gongronella butleri]
MTNVLIKSIPQVLLARILLQLFMIPQHVFHTSSLNLLLVIQDALRTYGDGCDLDGFLTFCCQQYLNGVQGPVGAGKDASENEETQLKANWEWHDAALTRTEDWDTLDEAMVTNNPVGIRIQVANMEARSCIKLIRHGTGTPMQDDRLTYNHRGRPVPIDAILRGTLDHLTRQHDGKAAAQQLHAPYDQEDGQERTSSSMSAPLTAIQGLIASRLSLYDKVKQETKVKEQRADYLLMGALLVREHGTRDPEWYLYLRDYIGDASGSQWRVLDGATRSEQEVKLDSMQVLADLRGAEVAGESGKSVKPTRASNAFRPFYMFYCSEAIVQDTCASRASGAPLVNGEASTSSDPSASGADGAITLADYTYDDEYEYAYADEGMDVGATAEEEAMEQALCKLCHIPDSINDLNTIFFCDHCDLGVHQLCENPPIQKFEFDIDPWYCRDCLALKGLPIPTPPATMADQEGATFKKRRIDYGS